MTKTLLLKILVLALDFCALIFILKSILSPARSKVRNLLVIIFLTLIIGQFAVYIDAKYIEPNWIEVKVLSLSGKKFGTELASMNIIQLSDLHIEKIGFREKSLIRKVNALNPDLVFITGDFVNERQGLASLEMVLSSLRVKKGIYAVLGDNDLIPELKAVLKKVNVHLLENENARVSVNDTSGLWVVGVSNEGLREETFNAAYFKVTPLEPIIVLAHSSGVMDSGFINPGNADLVLTGDTHGGQMGLAFVRRLSDYVKHYRYISGLYYINRVPVYVNNGIGLQEKKIRFLRRPEITRVILRGSLR